MIYAGKGCIWKICFAQYTDENRLLQSQLLWCEGKAELYLALFLLINELLYSDDLKLIPRFINPAPFSKFCQSRQWIHQVELGAYIG
jgi:hypothetical protein